MMSAYATVDLAVQEVINCAYDFITKSFKIYEVLCILAKGLEHIRLKKENDLLKNRLHELEHRNGFSEIVGVSQAIQSVLKSAKRVATHDTSVLVIRES